MPNAIESFNIQHSDLSKEVNNIFVSYGDREKFAKNLQEVVYWLSIFWNECIMAIPN